MAEAASTLPQGCTSTGTPAKSSLAKFTESALSEVGRGQRSVTSLGRCVVNGTVGYKGMVADSGGGSVVDRATRSRGRGGGSLPLLKGPY